MEKIESAEITLISSIKECDSHKNRIIKMFDHAKEYYLSRKK